MTEQVDAVLIFFASVGIEASIATGSTLEKLFAIPKQQFEQRREWIERWFILVESHEKYYYVRERLRGTGKTI